ncbi:MAG TPA: hypothetical protein VFE14_08945 [Micromonosporaceae bacterium]|jgi:hypothetical protein|nr:hypothetical protein [Micromonosporaceae bacterium]
MAREPAVPPAEFVAFVERRAPGLRAAAHALSGNDPLAESLVDDLLAATALRWRWFRFTERRTGRTGAADAYLDRIFKREAATWRADSWAGGRPPDPRTPTGGQLDRSAALELSSLAWDLRAKIRRRWLVAAAVVVALVLVVCGFPRQPPSRDVVPPPPATLPPLVDVLPPYAEQTTLATRPSPLPTDIHLDPAESAGWVSTHGVAKALAIFQPIGAPPMVLGSDGVTRQLDAGPMGDVFLSQGRTRPALTTASMSGDGTRVAFLGNDVVTVVDLRTAAARKYDALRASSALVWVTPQTLLVSGPSGAVVIDLQTGVRAPTTLDAQHVLTGQDGAQPAAPAPGAIPSPPVSAGPTPSVLPSPTGTGLPVGLAEKVIQLLPVGEPATAPARLRRYALISADAVTAVDTAITGDRISWLGPWREPGFLVGGPSGRAARDCDAAALNLPERYGRAEYATVVLQATTGQVQRSLIAPADATSLRGSLLLGWLDRDTALVRTGDGRSQHLISWRVTDGQLRLVSTVSRDSEISVADLTGR